MIPCVPNMQALLALKNHKDGELVRVSDLNQTYSYCEENDSWIPYYNDEEITSSEENGDFSLYQFNQMVISQLPDMPEEDIQKSKVDIRAFINLTKSPAYMLLCRELNYYTTFLVNDSYEEKMEDAVIECAQCLGSLKSVDYNEDENVIEIWFADDERAYVAFLFDYQGGIITCQ